MIEAKRELLLAVRELRQAKRNAHRLRYLIACEWVRLARQEYREVSASEGG